MCSGRWTSPMTISVMMDNHTMNTMTHETIIYEHTEHCWACGMVGIWWSHHDHEHTVGCTILWYARLVVGDNIMVHNIGNIACYRYPPQCMSCLVLSNTDGTIYTPSGCCKDVCVWVDISYDHISHDGQPWWATHDTNCEHDGSEQPHGNCHSRPCGSWWSLYML